MKRRYYTGRDVARALSIEELRQAAIRRLPSFAREYLESGGEDERTLLWNREIFQAVRFRPKTLVDTTSRSIGTTLLGVPTPSPLIIAPTGHNGIFCRDADLLLARAAASEGIPFTLSTLSNIALERLPTEAGGRLWMQLYVFSDDRLTEDIVARAERAGYEALVFTTDVNVFGWREWDRRQFRVPGKLTYRSLADILLHPSWAIDVLYPRGVPRLENVVSFFPPDIRDTSKAVTHIPNLFVPKITWKDVERLRKRWRGKLLVKGILRPDDALRAVAAGCDGIVVSNHGARHIDSCVTTLEVLPDVAAATNGRLALIVDGGFRRGSDVIKALALGADAVMIGRAALYGLIAGGQAGAQHAIRLLNSESERVLGQIGCNRLGDLGPDILSPGKITWSETIGGDRKKQTQELSVAAS
jgi:(S)-mandelate dehydrogenase